MWSRRAAASCGPLLAAQLLRDSESRDHTYRKVPSCIWTSVGCSWPFRSAHTRIECEERTFHQGYDWLALKHRDTGGEVGNLAGKLDAPRWPGPKARLGEASFTAAEVQRRDGTGEDGKMWVTYRDGVYDVTEYIKEHPGGKFLLQAAGGPVDGWWRYWGQHQISKKVVDVLEQVRIGHLSDHAPDDDEERWGQGLWEDEQLARGRAESRQTSAVLVETPFQTETCLSELVRDFITPSGKFYVRNHAPVPHVETADEHLVTFSMHNEEVAALSLGELKKRFSSKRIISVLQCTGNRAADYIAMNGFETSGFVGGDGEFIGLGMLGNASWSGLRLDEVLPELLPQLKSLSPSELDSLYVSFEGLDGYYTAVPLSVVLCAKTDCLLAFGMNGEELNPDHGFPLRAFLPGIAGARSVKWVSGISVIQDPDSPWLVQYYKEKKTEGATKEPIFRLPMNSVILSPEPGAWLDATAETLEVRGVAYPGGTLRRITRVDVSADRGQSWQEARCHFSDLSRDDSRGPSKSWVRFEITVELPPQGSGVRGSGRIAGAPLTEIWCRAHDDHGNVQPPLCPAYGGYRFNGYHRVPIVRSLGGPPLARPGRPR